MQYITQEVTLKVEGDKGEIYKARVQFVSLVLHECLGRGGSSCPHVSGCVTG